MRVVIVGASPLAIMATRSLLKDGHEVVIIEQDAPRVDTLSEELDCGFVNADGSRPAVLREVSPENSDFLFCLSGSDQDNIIASLVGQTLGFDCVVTKIEDPDFESVGEALDLDNVIIPDREIAGRLADRVNGRDLVDLSKLMEGGIRFFVLRLGTDHPKTIADLDLPSDTLVMAVTRGSDVFIASTDAELQEDDKLTLLTDESNIAELKRLADSNDEAD